MRRSVIAENLVFGAAAEALSAGSAELNLDDCLVANNTSAGVQAAGTSGGTATVRVMNCIITDNAFGLFQGGTSTIESLGNNMVRGSGTDKTGTITIVTAD